MGPVIHGRNGSSRHSILMLVENTPYPQDVRVRAEAEVLVDAGHRVMVLAPRGPGQGRTDRIRRVEVRRFRVPRNARTPAGLVREYAVAHVQMLAITFWHVLRGVGVVHLHNPPDTLFPVGLIAKAFRRRFVFDNHDLFPDLFVEKFGRSRAVGALRVAQQACMRLADLVITTNESQREVALGVRRRGPRDAVVVVRNGPRQANLPSPADLRDGELEDPHLLFLGTIASQDGVFELPELLRVLRDEHRLAGVRLTMVGDGPARRELEAEFTRLELGDRLTITGWIDHEQVAGRLAQADVGIDPAACSDLNHRTTMMKIAEYLAAGRPVVAYELLETVRTAGEAALLVECGDRARFAAQIARIAREPALRAELRRRALRRRDALVWERSARELLRAYSGLAAGSAWGIPTPVDGRAGSRVDEGGASTHVR